MYHIITWDLRQNVIQIGLHVHICSCQNENYLLVMSMCGTGQMTCRKPAKFLEVLFWMLSAVPHHYLRFETECHTDVHVHICSCQNENYLLVMSMCGTGQMTCRKPANIFRSTILDAKWCTTSLLEIWDRMSYRCTCTYLLLSKWKLFIGHVHVWDWSDDL